MSFKNWLKAFWANEVGAVCIGCGLKTVDGILTAEISESAGNALTCNEVGTGLYVPGVVAGISEVDCNAISDNAGLWAPCQRGVADRAQMDSPQNASLPVATAGVGTYGFESTLVSIVNDTCRDVAGIITIRAGGLFIDTDAGGCKAIANLDVDIDAVGWNPATPDTRKIVHGASLFGDFNNMQENNYVLVLAGDTVTYKARLIIDLQIGIGNIHGGVSFEFDWVLVPTAAC